MTEALLSFLVSVTCIIGIAILLPCMESLVRRLRRTPAPDSPQVVRLTPIRSPRRQMF